MNSYKTIQDIHDAFDTKTLTPLAWTQAYFKKIHGSQHNAYLTLCEDRALEQAKACEQELKQNGKVPRQAKPLFGIPLGIKDVLAIEGVRTTCASKILENYIPPYTATAIQKLEAAGAIILGKLNMDEFAMGSSNENSAFGPVVHPTHPDRVPGGSSGGSGTAVAADLCWAALGTDTGGSIRLPASYCGVVGMKPTYGRISRYGQIAFASSLDQIGPMTKSVEDAAILCKVMVGQDEMDATSSPEVTPVWVDSMRALDCKKTLSGLKVGIPKEYFGEGISAEVQSAVKAQIQSIQDAGATVAEVSLPHTAYAVATYYLIAVSEASSNLSRYDGVRYGVRPPDAIQATSIDEFYKKVRSQFGAEVKRRIILGTFALSAGYYDAYYRRASQVRRLIAQDFETVFKVVDVLMAPVSPTTAPLAGKKAQSPLEIYLSDILTTPASLAGLPAMSVPIGVDRDGLPIGMQLIASRFNEAKLFQAALGVESLRGSQK